ncbi:Long chronological lifespan protein 2 [Amphichorda felina]
MRYLIALLSLLAVANAQFGGFFDQMFGSDDGHAGHGRGHHSSNSPSDASHYRHRYESSVCDRYLCPDTLACVHFPHHCPCAWDAHEDKFELGEGKKVCVSRGGFKPTDASRKIELARKGLL